MNQVFESVTVTISKREYAELLGKAFAFDAYRKQVKARHEKGYALLDIEEALFLDEEPKLPDPTSLYCTNKMPEELNEEPEPIFTEEEWDKLAAEAEQAEAEQAEDKEV